MAGSLRLYDIDDSPFCIKVRICLHLKQADYERIPLTLGRLRQLRRLNPAGKVPVLLTEDAVVPESSDIVRLLEQRFPKPALIPKDPEARAYCTLLEDWSASTLYWLIGAFKFLQPRNRKRTEAVSAEMAPALMPGWLVGKLVRRSMTRRYRVWGCSERSLPHCEVRMRESLEHLRDLLGEKPFLLGPYVTLADISVYAQLTWMRRYDEARLIEENDAVRSWMARLDEIEEIRVAATPSR